MGPPGILPHRHFPHQGSSTAASSLVLLLSALGRLVRLARGGEGAYPHGRTTLRRRRREHKPGNRMAVLKGFASGTLKFKGP
jgi:hypothetical protein